MGKGLALVAIVLLSRASPADACTTFCTQTRAGVYVGKSYDWHLGSGQVVINKRRVSKTALVMQGTPAKWVSRYASLTFNQYGREFPNGGINEKGLVVEIMWLDNSEYPAAGKQPTINELQWIQHLLDTAATLEQAVQRARQLRVTPVAARVHYLVCDAKGSCGAFEYIGGRLVISRGKSMPHRALTNDTYRDSVAHLRKHRGFGGKRATPTDKSSKARFVIAARGAATSAKDPISGAFEVLDRVRNGDYSKWNIVYDLHRKRAYFRTLGHDSIKYIDLMKIDPSCAAGVRTLEMNSDLEGDLTGRLGDYRQVDNRELVAKNMKKTKVPALLIQVAAAYPLSTQCQSTR